MEVGYEMDQIFDLMIEASDCFWDISNIQKKEGGI